MTLQEAADAYRAESIELARLGVEEEMVVKGLEFLRKRISDQRVRVNQAETRLLRASGGTYWDPAQSRYLRDE